MIYSCLRLKIIVGAVFVTLCPLLATPAQTPGDSGTSSREFLEKARGAIVVLTGEDKAGLPVAPGLGFWIGRNLIATDNRVVQSAVRLHVTVPGQQSKPMEVTSRDSYRYATVLTVAGAQAASLPLGDSEKVAVNDRVYLVGDSASQAEASQRSLGKIVIFNDGRYFQVATPLSSASRGGPVLNSKGEVIGIAGESLDGPSETFVIPAAYLTTLLLRDRSVGSGGGMGPGPGTGSGPGSNEGMGMGRGAPSTGPGQGSGVFDGNVQPRGQQSTAKSFDTRPVLLNNVAPHYTEEARNNKTQGTVALRILVGEDGNVKRVQVIRGLPDGLDEQAIAAAYQLKFKPATLEGKAVSHWMSIQMEFKLR